MITLKDIEDNKKLYKQKVKNKNFVPYVDLLFTYIFDESIDFSEFINDLSTIEDKKTLQAKLKEILSKGKPKQLPKKERLAKKYKDVDYDYFETNDKERFINKNSELVDDLSYIRDNALGIGTNKIKRRLNIIAKTDPVAMALRIAMEIEDKNIQAKKYYGEYKDKIYAQKSILIYSLIDVFDSYCWIYGIQDSDVEITDYIIYFEIPGCKQISFHTNIWNVSKIPIYEKEWDGLINSTYNKVLETVKNLYGDQILKKK